MKNKLFLFILGLISAIFLIAICLGAGLMGYSAGGYFINKIESRMQSKNKPQTIAVPLELNLGFELPSDMAIFNPQEAGAEISDRFFTEGKHSLLVEFPAARPNPGIFFDILGNGCLDWSRIEAFTCNVFNSVPAKANITLRIKSGEKYPKRVFMKGYELVPESMTKIILERKEIEGKLDLDKISYLGFIMSDPSTTFRLYFDEMKVVKE